MKQILYLLHFKNETIKCYASSPLNAYFEVCLKRSHLEDNVPEIVEDEHGRIYHIDVKVTQTSSYT